METEQRVSRLEGAYEQVDRRLDGMERSIDGLRAETGGFRAEVNSRFNTLYIIIAGLWVSTVGLLIGLYFR